MPSPPSDVAPAAPFVGGSPSSSSTFRRSAEVPRGADGRPLRLGALVWVSPEENEAVDAIERLGQLGPRRYPRRGVAAEEGSLFVVHLLDGSSVDVPDTRLREARDLPRPGDDGGEAFGGGGDGAFDVLLGPETMEDVLREEITTCLFEKGFCVLRLPQSPESVRNSLGFAEALDVRGELARLPEEVEEHYLGAGFSGKTAWLDPTSEPSGAIEDELISDRDECLSNLGALLQDHVQDFLGARFVERTPALLALSLDEAQEEAYPFPEADNEVLGVFLGTWRRQLLKAMYFFGPAPAEAALVRRESRSFTRALPSLDSYTETVDLRFVPGTLLLFDPRLFSLVLSTAPDLSKDPVPSLLLTASFLRLAPKLVLDGVEGDLSMLAAATGPPPPPGDGLVNVTGMATRMGGCLDEPEHTYAGLVGCIDCVTRIPYSRFDIDVYLAIDQDNMLGWQTYAQHMSVVEGAQLFAAKAFEISNVEAKGMDPRQRHIMEVGAKALAEIGVTKQSANRQVRNAGVSVGTDGHEWPSYPKEDLGGLGNSSNALGITANRFSFVFNLRGPNFIVDTACSASLYAAHYIKLSLLQRDWDPLEFCLALGTQLFISVGGFVGCAQAHMLSQAGRCFTFNATADGYQRGDGTSGFVMQYGAVREDAYGLFRGSNANQDGRSASLTAPNGPAQEQCIWGAIREAKMQPPESTVWECHGTGTSLGDPIEVGAVRKVQIKQARTVPLMIGSIKSNMGHLEGGAAMSAMVKCILQVNSARCCPTSHFTTLNPHLEHSKFDAFFETESARFAHDRGHSQVSSFGFGGSNGHGIFWGENFENGKADTLTLMEKKLRRHAAPEVRPVGSNPDDWDSDWPDLLEDCQGQEWTVEFREDDDEDAPLRWTRVMQEPSSLGGDLGDEDLVEASFAIVGNFNEWTGDLMEVGRVPGSHVAVVRVPVEGALEFRFLKDCDEAQVLAPASERCGRKTERILGPASGLETFWRVEAEVASEVEIQLFVANERRSLLWIRRR